MNEICFSLTECPRDEAEGILSGEEAEEPGRGVEGGRYGVFFEVAMQVGEVVVDEARELVEAELWGREVERQRNTRIERGGTSPIHFVTIRQIG